MNTISEQKDKYTSKAKIEFDPTKDHHKDEYIPKAKITFTRNPDGSYMMQAVNIKMNMLLN